MLKHLPDEYYISCRKNIFRQVQYAEIYIQLFEFLLIEADQLRNNVASNVVCAKRPYSLAYRKVSAAQVNYIWLFVKSFQQLSNRVCVNGGGDITVRAAAGKKWLSRIRGFTPNAFLIDLAEQLLSRQISAAGDVTLLPISSDASQYRRS